MAHKHSIYDSDPHFLIDATTRAITNLSDVKTSIVQGDHNSERFTFEMPQRFVDGHDMSLCNKVQVHFINQDTLTKEQVADVYEVTDLQLSPADENVVICSWLLSGNATKYAGALSFVVRFACMDGDRVEYAWHTSIFAGISVSKGINNSEAVTTEYSDVLEAWRVELASNVFKSLEQTKYGESNDGVNVWTVTFGDGSTSDFVVRDGADGKTPTLGVDYWTPEEQEQIYNTHTAYIDEELKKRTPIKPEFAQSVDECTDTNKLYVLPDGYIYAFTLPEITYEGREGGYYDSSEEWQYTGSNACKWTNVIPAAPGDIFQYTGRGRVRVPKDVPSVIYYYRTVSGIEQEMHEVFGSTSEGAVTELWTAPEGTYAVKFFSYVIDSTDLDDVTLDVRWIYCSNPSNGQWVNTGHKLVESDVDIAVPTKVSELENDAGFITSEDVPEVEVPAKLSELVNDVGFVTDDDVPEKLSDLHADSITGSQVSIGASALTISGGSIYINKADYGFYVSGNRIQNVATPEDSADAATKGYVDGLVGNVELALDSIIALENELIGGDA